MHDTRSSIVPSSQGHATVMAVVSVPQQRKSDQERDSQKKNGSGFWWPFILVDRGPQYPKTQNWRWCIVVFGITRDGWKNGTKLWKMAWEPHHWAILLVSDGWISAWILLCSSAIKSMGKPTSGFTTDLRKRVSCSPCCVCLGPPRNLIPVCHVTTSCEAFKLPNARAWLGCTPKGSYGNKAS